MKRESTLLFNTYDLDSVLLAQAKKIKVLTFAVSPPTLLEKSVEELVPDIEREIRIEPLELLENDVSVDQEETKVDVSQDFKRHIRDCSLPFYIDAARFDDTEVPGLPSTISYINLQKITPEDLAEKIIRKLHQN